MESNVPATTGEPAVPAPRPEPPPTPNATDSPGPRQNVTAGLYPIALGLLILLGVALAFWTLMSLTGGGA